MKFCFLGTGAADYQPAWYTGLEERLDRDVRRASSAILEKNLLLDCGPHVLDCLRIAGYDPAAITDVLITHFHSDHFNAGSLETLAKLSADRHGRQLRFWVREDAVPKDIPGIEVHRMKIGQTYELEDGTRVTGLLANHQQEVWPQHLLVEKEHKKIFYGMDGGWFLTDTYNYLRDQKLDLMILDCTVGDYLGDYRLAVHNSIPMIRLMIPSLKTVGIIDEHTRLWISHLARTLHASFDETEEICLKDGIHVAYDGCVLEL
ncbi:MAG: MBL fold metallo-hydrolase [Firmicutes bacterium]|nr:MBL fold metallo-hydrolase [Bacillota bacterium]